MLPNQTIDEQLDLQEQEYRFILTELENEKNRLESISQTSFKSQVGAIEAQITVYEAKFEFNEILKSGIDKTRHPREIVFGNVIQAVEKRIDRNNCDMERRTKENREIREEVERRHNNRKNGK